MCFTCYLFRCALQNLCSVETFSTGFFFFFFFCLQCQHNENDKIKGVECEIEETPGGAGFAYKRISVTDMEGHLFLSFS